MGGRPKFTQEQFIDEVLLLHSEKCDQHTFSRLEFSNLRNKVELKCKLHDWFEARPEHILDGGWCFECGIERRKLGIEKFKTRVIKIHANKCDDLTFLKAVYKNNYEKVTLRCKKHGYFDIKVHNCITLGQWCKKCADEVVADVNRKTQQEFIDDVKRKHPLKIHDHLFDGLNYIGGKDFVTLICKDHGEFKIRADSYLSGFWCFRCSCAKSEVEIEWLRLNKVPSKCWQGKVIIEGCTFKPDALVKKTNTIY